MERARQALDWDNRSEIVKTGVLLVLVVGVTLGGYGVFMAAMGTGTPLVVVTSESMVPAINVGDLLVLQGRTEEGIQVGDIIVYQDDWNPNPIVHRVVEIEEIEGVSYYYTRGDANDQRDPGNRTIDEIVGEVVLIIPQIGHVSLWLKEPAGQVAVVVIFILILVIPEFVCNEEADEEETEDLPRSDEQ
ncbi:signal peptidase I [Candidatus Thorarchaeota archaeon]|nr:MAG: signal peptidase I [Candidatus Thorarchaeota archaeon]